MGRATRLSGSKSTQHLRPQNAVPNRGLHTSASNVSLAFPHSASLHSLLVQASQVRTSGTWTTSSGELGLLGDTDEVEDRSIFVHEYNQLAKKHGVRLLIVDDFTAEQQGDFHVHPEKRGWIQRLLRSNHLHHHHVPLGPNSHLHTLQLAHRKSVSDLAHMIRSRRDPPKIICIQEMVRLSGKSILYLPQDYAPCSLVLPTCLRATAQYLAQNATTRGIFRVPGSLKSVCALFDHYCYSDLGGDDITGTVRCASLPSHIAYSVHDVASTFKKLLSVLPGGILGSLALFDALVAIQSQLNGEPEFPRTKQTKVRARLIALAIGTVKSQFRRELICAVIGLLSLIGRVAEVTPREDDDSRPLPTADLMGYHALGIIFGPLLMGDLLDQYSMKLAAPSAGMLLFPLSPPKFRRDRRKTLPDLDRKGPPIVDRILVANNIAEMLIANWRDVVRQMKSLGAHNRRDAYQQNHARPDGGESSSSFRPQTSGTAEGNARNDHADREGSPDSGTPTPKAKRRRSMSIRSAVSHKLLPKMSYMTLSPTWEESPTEDDLVKNLPDTRDDSLAPAVTFASPEQQTTNRVVVESLQASNSSRQSGTSEQMSIAMEKPGTGASDSQVCLDSVPPRVSSRPRGGEAESEATHTIMSCTINNHTEMSPAPCVYEARAMQKQAQADMVSRNVSSYDGSDESSMPFHSPSCDNTAIDNGYLSPTKWHGNRPGTASSPARHGALHRMRNLLRPATSPSDYKIAPIRVPQAVSEDKLRHRDEQDPGESLKDVAGFRKPENIASDEPVHRGSMSRTPERFYASKERQEQEGGNDVGTDSRWHRKLRQYASSDRNLLSRQPRVARSHGQLGESVRVEVQSPSNSSSSEDPRQRASVKAMAALFKLHGPIRSQPMSPIKVEVMQEDELEKEQITRRCKCGRIVTAEQTESDDSSQETESRLIGMKRSMPMLASDRTRQAAYGKLKSIPSLGTMVPHREQPSVAHHLNLPRPLSTPPRSRQDAEVAPLAGSSLLNFDSHPRGTTVLYSQIQILQRNLSAKTEEVAQLRRQLDAQENSEVGTLCEQLRSARRDLSMWKERAEAAEKRVQVFKRFTARLRDIKAAMTMPNPTSAHTDEAVLVSDSRQPPMVSCPLEPIVMADKDEQGGEAGDAEGICFASTRLETSTEGYSPMTSIRRTSFNAEHASLIGVTGGDGAWSSPGSGIRMADKAVMEGAEKVWAAAEELLLMEDDSSLSVGSESGGQQQAWFETHRLHPNDS